MQTIIWGLAFCQSIDSRRLLLSRKSYDILCWTMVVLNIVPVLPSLSLGRSTLGQIMFYKYFWDYGIREMKHSEKILVFHLKMWHFIGKQGRREHWQLAENAIAQQYWLENGHCLPLIYLPLRIYLGLAFGLDGFTMPKTCSAPGRHLFFPRANNIPNVPRDGLCHFFKLNWLDLYMANHIFVYLKHDRSPKLKYIAEGFSVWSRFARSIYVHVARVYGL